MTPVETTSAERHLSLQDLPAWARAAAIVGIPGVIALYLVYMLANAIPAKLEAHANESRATGTQTLQVLQRICAHTAATPEERTACWSIR